VTHRTKRSRAIGSNFVAPKNDTIKEGERIAPTIANTLHKPHGTHHPITASVARIDNPCHGHGEEEPGYWKTGSRDPAQEPAVTY
jgi:hypothetical protein